MALKLTLKPGERVAVNGAVLVNGDRRASLLVENPARVLRERDILQPAEATTPAKRVYLPIMLMYLEAKDEERLRAEYEARMAEFAYAVSTPDTLKTCAEINAAVAGGALYKALTLCRSLIHFEKSRLPDVA